jgi:hypothetical protein
MPLVEPLNYDILTVRALNDRNLPLTPPKEGRMELENSPAYHAGFSRILLMPFEVLRFWFISLFL